VIWPENSSDIDPYTDPGANAAISQAVREMGVPVLVGAVVEAPDGTHNLNRLIVWDPVTGMGQTYDKTRLVPFGEFLPFRSVLTKVITRFNRIPQDFEPGTRAGVLDIGPLTAAAAICFEVSYDDVVRNAVNAGGKVLLVPSNNADYAHTGQTQQQVAIDQVRAVEHGRWTLQVATSGESAVISPDGAIVQHTAEMTPAYLEADVRQSTYKTFADRVGAVPEWILAATGLLAAVLAGGFGGRLRRRIGWGADSAAAPGPGADTAPAAGAATDTETAAEPGLVQGADQGTGPDADSAASADAPASAEMTTSADKTADADSPLLSST
jgi:apolipoprotein N-acyltransferase